MLTMWGMIHHISVCHSTHQHTSSEGRSSVHSYPPCHRARPVPAPPPPWRWRDSKHLYYLLTQNQPVYVYSANLCLSIVFWETKPKITCLLNSRSLKLNVLAKIYSIVGSTSVQLSNKDRHNDRQPAASRSSPGSVQCAGVTVTGRTKHFHRSHDDTGPVLSNTVH